MAHAHTHTRTHTREEVLGNSEKRARVSREVVHVEQALWLRQWKAHAGYDAVQPVLGPKILKKTTTHSTAQHSTDPTRRTQVTCLPVLGLGEEWWARHAHAPGNPHETLMPAPHSTRTRWALRMASTTSLKDVTCGNTRRGMLVAQSWHSCSVSVARCSSCLPEAASSELAGVACARRATTGEPHVWQQDSSVRLLLPPLLRNVPPRCCTSERRGHGGRAGSAVTRLRLGALDMPKANRLHFASCTSPQGHAQDVR